MKMAHRWPPRRRYAGPNEDSRVELSWYGMLSHTTVRELLDLQQRIRADLIFLSESYLNKCKADKLRRDLNLESMFVVESDGQAGGLVLFIYL